MKKKECPTLGEYLESRGMKQQFFAKEIGATPATISRIIGQGYTPTLKMAIDIEKYTKGEISVYSWTLHKVAHSIRPKHDNTKKNK